MEMRFNDEEMINGISVNLIPLPPYMATQSLNEYQMIKYGWNEGGVMKKKI